MEVGLDECARGPGFGRMYASAVILDDTFLEQKPDDVYIRDSKTLSERQRNIAYDYIVTNSFEYTTSFIEPWDIDKKGVTWANQELFHKCLDQLNASLIHIYVDGNYFIDYTGIDHTCIVKGDTKRLDIACASIVAKVTHDKYIKKVCTNNDYIKYNINTNKGYLTKAHIESLKKYGPTRLHRMIYLKNILPISFKDD